MMWRARLDHFASPDVYWLDALPRPDRVLVLAVRMIDRLDGAGRVGIPAAGR